MAEFENIIYETPEQAIARIWLNRPKARNAQNTKLLYELNDAFDKAIADQHIKVIILAAKGPHFSAGHDLMERPEHVAATMEQHNVVGSWHSNEHAGAESLYCREKEIYEGFCRRWRDLSKPTIASVHGKVIAGGLMLVWPCDFVIASEDASFQDNTVAMGIPGVEYFVHAWELGIRKAKEFLLTGEPISASEAHALGMVNKVVDAEKLQEQTLVLARKIASKPMFALKLGKDAINAVYSAQGYDNVQKNAFNAHHLAHTHYRLSTGMALDPDFMQGFMSKTPKK